VIVTSGVVFAAAALVTRRTASLAGETATSVRHAVRNATLADAKTIRLPE
jgi:hypothetical protein